MERGRKRKDIAQSAFLKRSGRLWRKYESTLWTEFRPVSDVYAKFLCHPLPVPEPTLIIAYENLEMQILIQKSNLAKNRSSQRDNLWRKQQ